MSVILELNGASLTRQNKRLLNQLDVQIPSGQMTAVIGPNGAGKSSLLWALSGEWPLSAGQRICPAWSDIAGASERAWQARHLAVLPQASYLNFSFRVDEVVMLARSPHNSGFQRDRDIVAQALAALDIADLAGTDYTRLSGGERQRVHLARVLAQLWEADDGVPRVLLLDEPTAALDLAHQHSLMQLLQERIRGDSAGLAVVMVLHDLNLASQYADALLCLRGGEMLAQGSVDEVLTTATLEQVFACSVSFLQHPHTGRPVVVYGA